MGHIPLRPGDVVRIRDERWSVTRHVEGANGALLDVCGRDRDNRGVRASFVLPSEPCERLPRSTTARLVRARTWRRRARAALANATPAPDALRTRARDALALLPFQLEPALAVTRGRAARILIADEVGLGKTVQAGLVINEVLLRRPDGHALVVAPAGLRAQWRDELNGRLGIDATVLDSPALARHGWTYGGNPWSAHRVVITSLDYVKRPEVLRSLEALVWDVIVFDEAHALTGRSDRAAAANALAERARTVVLLTATPHSGDDEAFDRLCGTGDLQRSFPLSIFRRSRADVGLTGARRTTSLRVRPTPVETEMHRAVAAYGQLVWAQQGRSSAGARLVALVLCRRAFSSAASLARSIERRLMLLGLPEPGTPLQALLPFDDVTDDDEPDALLAIAGLDDAGEERAWLEQLLELARRASLDESKLRTLERYLGRARQPVIVFTEYRDTLVTLSAALGARRPLLLHGGMAAAERHDSARRFNEGESSVLLATDAASEGLNLHRRCRLVINLELPWTPVRLEQRIGRVERIGQTRRVHAVHLLASGTSEEQSVARLLMRARHAGLALSDITPLDDSETTVADGAIDGAPPVSRSPGMPSRFGPALDLHQAAEQEAARLELSRLLASDADPLPSDPRPCVTLLRRRNGMQQVYWLYRLSCVDRDLQVVWESLSAFTAGVRTDARCWRDIATSLATPTTHLWEAVSRQHDLVFARAITALQAANDLSARRERAIEESLMARHARLSAAVLQRGLFDRRGERAAASQTAVIEQALERCRTRLREIDALASIASDEMSLAFAVLFR